MFLIRKGLLVLAVLFVIGWVVGLLKATPPTGSGQATTAGTRSATAGADPDCGVRKKDGSLDARECDLRELCKDWVFYRREITRYGREGDTAKASEARASFNKINVWLSAYDDSAVSACLQRNGG